MKYHIGETGSDPLEKYDDLFSSPPEYISADVETISITDPTPLGVGFSTPAGDTFYVPMYEENFPWHLFSKETETRVIWYNAPFDLGRQAFGRFPEVDLSKTEDAIIPARHQAFNSATLEDVSHHREVAHEARSMKSVLDTYGVKTVDKLAEEVVAKKCLEDAEATMDIWHWLRPKITDEYYNQERDFLVTLLNMSHTGTRKNEEQLNAIHRELEADLLRLQGKVDQFGFNPYSANEVCNVLNEDGYWLPMTRKDNPITKEEVLEKIPHPAAQLTILYKKYTKLLNTYVRPWLTEDRIHSQFRMDATTGRTSSAAYNLQNIPKGDRQGAIVPKAGNLRTIFMPDDYFGTKWDLKQIELRVLAWLSGDLDMKEILDQPDSNLHRETMAACHTMGYFITYTEAKNINFGMIYGGGDTILANMTGIDDLRVIRHIKAAWIARFPVAWAWIENQKIIGLRDLEVETAFGRKLNISTSIKGLGSERHIENCAVNWPIQGTAAEIFKRISNEMTDNLIPLMNHRSQIHDEFWEDGAWYIPEDFEHLIDGLWTPIDWEIVTTYG